MILQTWFTSLVIGRDGNGNIWLYKEIYTYNLQP
jgi:hypothetical protein